MYVQQYWNNVLWTGHNEKGLKPAINSSRQEAGVADWPVALYL